MLNTLITLGNKITQQQDEWDNLLENIHLKEKTSKGDIINNHVLVVTFDIDSQTITFENGLKSYSTTESPKKYRNIKSDLWGRNGYPWMITCCYPKKISILQKSIFGKPNKDIGQGLFQKSLLESYPEAKDTVFCKALEACYSLRNISIEEGIIGVNTLEKGYIAIQLKLTPNNKVVMLTIAIKAESLGIKEPTLLCQLDGYDTYVKKNFSKEVVPATDGSESLCYATGKRMANVTSPKFPDREDLNKLFVTKTINYAGNFDKRSYAKNYQIDANIQKSLQNGSDYIRGKLNNQRCSVRIANTPHYVIPVFLDPQNVDIKSELDSIQKMSEWIFSTKQLENTIESLELELESEKKPYWINYIAFKSDGNSVKVINHIKDVSNTWFSNIVEKDLEQSNLIFKYFDQRHLNLSTIYYAMPDREDHEQKNDALKLLSQILEQRKVCKEKIFHHFTNLILYHRYNRYRSYSNVKVFKRECFDTDIKDSVIKYFFLLNLLKSLKLTDMEDNKKTDQVPPEGISKLHHFFTDMGYSPQQQSLYWLGRIINKVGTAQYKKGHQQKPVLNKINYNGMDHYRIQRLYVDAFELSVQYKIANEINYYSNMFSQAFPAEPKLWNLSPQEGVFYILSGISLYFDNNQ